MTFGKGRDTLQKRSFPKTSQDPFRPDHSHPVRRGRTLGTEHGTNLELGQRRTFCFSFSQPPTFFPEQTSRLISDFRHVSVNSSQSRSFLYAPSKPPTNRTVRRLRPYAVSDRERSLQFLHRLRNWFRKRERGDPILFTIAERLRNEEGLEYDQDVRVPPRNIRNSRDETLTLGGYRRQRYEQDCCVLVKDEIYAAEEFALNEIYGRRIIRKTSTESVFLEEVK